MTRICNFPISQTKHCKQPMADGKPNCGRHMTSLSTDQLGESLTVYRKNGRLHIWAGKPDGFYCLIHSDPAYQALCQLAGETLPCCLGKAIRYTDGGGRLHRDDGPAQVKSDGTQEWYQHGKRHRDDGPAIIRMDGTQEWYRYGELHREDGPARIYPDGTQEWHWHGWAHREDGPAVIGPGGPQWWWHGRRIAEEKHNELREQSRSV